MVQVQIYQSAKELFQSSESFFWCLPGLGEELSGEKTVLFFFSVFSNSLLSAAIFTEAVKVTLEAPKFFFAKRPARKGS